MSDLKRIRPGKDVMDFMLSMSQDRTIRRMHLGIDEAVKGSAGSLDVFCSFVKAHPDLASTLAAKLGTSFEELQQAFEKQVAEPSAKNAASRVSKESAFSETVQTAMWQSRETPFPTEDGCYCLGELIYQLAKQEGQARHVLLSIATDESIEVAFQAIRPFRNEDDKAFDFGLGDMNKLLDSVWPQVQKEQEESLDQFGGDRLRNLKEKSYAENPDHYEKSLDIASRLSQPMPDKHLFMAKTEIYLHAAQNEARIRRAPEVKLDHMFLALLQDGTDTSGLLDSRGVDRGAWRTALDDALPRFQDGPRWPPNARDLGMNMPDEGKQVRWLKDIPEEVDLTSISSEERKSYFELLPGDRVFTDLYWLQGVAKEVGCMGYELLLGEGITLDLILAKLKVHETGDPNWFLVRPDLIGALKEPKEGSAVEWLVVQKACEAAAQYEARLRWAPKVEFEHLLLALLAQDTDTRNLLTSLGFDCEGASKDVDALLPIFESGPYFPEMTDSTVFDSLLFGEGGSSDLQIIEYRLLSHVRGGMPLGAGMDLLVSRGLTVQAVQKRLDELGIGRSPLWIAAVDEP